MMKLVIFATIVAMAAARPGFVPSVYGAAIGEKTIESHGNAIVHSSVPVVQTYAAPAPLVYPSPLLLEKTVTGYGHSLFHGGPVLAHSPYVAPAYYL